MRKIEPGADRVNPERTYVFNDKCEFLSWLIDKYTYVYNGKELEAWYGFDVDYTEKFPKKVIISAIPLKSVADLLCVVYYTCKVRIATKTNKHTYFVRFNYKHLIKEP